MRYPVSAYIVQPGDTLWGICRDLDVDFALTRDINRHVMNADVIRPGDAILVPATIDTPPPPPPPPPSGGGLLTALDATSYGLSNNGSPSANTAALKACVNAAIDAGRNVFIPAGRYLGNNGYVTPRLGAYAQGLEFTFAACSLKRGGSDSRPTIVVKSGPLNRKWRSATSTRSVLSTEVGRHTTIYTRF